MSLELTRLRAFLTGIPSGNVNPEDQLELETLLASCWDDLAKSDTGGMNPQKLFSRMENLSWHHPTLQFEIEGTGASPSALFMQKCSPGQLTLRMEKRRLTRTGDGAW